MIKIRRLNIKLQQAMRGGSETQGIGLHRQPHVALAFPDRPRTLI